MPYRQIGFTLIEMMIVLLIASIILTAAVPGYRQYVLRAGRVDATNALLRVAAAQEKFYLQNGVYAANSALAAAPPAGLGFTASQSDRGYYNLAITPSAGGFTVGYTVSATTEPAEKQKDDTDCTAFSLDQSGRRGANGGYDAATVEKCWR